MFDFNEANRFGTGAMDTMMKSCSSMARGFQTLANEASDFSKKSFEDGTSAIEKMAGARSFEKALEIQADYARTSYEAFVSQATRMGEIYSDIAKQAYTPYEAAAASKSGKA